MFRTQPDTISMMAFRLLRTVLLGMLVVVISACGAAYEPVIPTEQPTATPTFTPTATRTPGFGSAPTITPTRLAASPTGGPSPTPLFGPSRTPAPDDPTPTRILDPNAPRIEFFTSDVLAVEPGESLTLFWSTRGTDNAIIYRLDSSGQRNQLWNVAPDGNLAIPTKKSDRGQVQFVLRVGDDPLAIEQPLVIPLACPIQWFFAPAPEVCADNDAEPTTIIEQPFERGRMIYLQTQNIIYVLFNDDFDPAWVAFENRYDPAIHPESAENFVPPPGRYQPLAILGYIWRGNDTIRNRLGLGIDEEVVFDGFLQTARTPGGSDNLYISSANGTVLQLLPNGSTWQIITPP